MSSPSPQPIRRSEPEGITITSNAGATLFYHDEEVIASYNTQLDTSAQHITSLEKKLRSITRDYETTRNSLYESQVARHTEASTRMTLQRHLRLENQRVAECAQSYQSLQLQYSQMSDSSQNIFAMNEMLRQEVEHNKHIIESLTGRILEYENSAQRVLQSPREEQPWTYPEPPCTEPVSSPGYTFVDESPLIPAMLLESKSQSGGKKKGKWTKNSRTGGVLVKAE